jgi:hypothetical protein
MIRMLTRVALVAAAFPIVVLAADTKFTSTWASPEARQVSFTGKKVATVVMSADENLRVSGEEGLVTELKARGIDAVAAYRMIPKEELKDPDKARGWFERGKVEGVVVMRPISMGKQITYVPPTWNSGYYSSLWGYYGYGWGAMYDPGYVRDDMVVAIETLIYSVPKNALLWAGSSESRNPKDSRKLLADLVKQAAKEMKKQGLSVK